MVRKAALFTVVFLVGFLAGCFTARGVSSVFRAGKSPAGGGIDTAGIGRAQELAGGIGTGLNSLEESLGVSRSEVEQSRSLVSGSLSELGAVGSGLDALTGRLGEAQDRAGRIEEAGRRIEQTLGAF
ncbi:MAG: hypothetical protein FWG29_01805 [Treponema sp.]|nr:hypothetical protein [Treponema sp.]